MFWARCSAGVWFFTRKGNDFTKRFPTIAAAIETLAARSCLVDGEAIVCDENGLAVFDLIRRRRSSHADAILCAFDLLEFDGDDMRKLPIERRKIVLARLLGRAPPPGIALNAHRPGEPSWCGVSAAGMKVCCQNSPLSALASNGNAAAAV